MSTGVRISLQTALGIAAKLFKVWGLDENSSFVVGSVRRGKPDVGDIEILVPPAVTLRRDDLYERISNSLKQPKGALFASDAPTAINGFADRGLKQGFKSADIILVGGEGEDQDAQLKVQLIRYDSMNLGWKMIMHTGPRDFGMYFLSMWKREYGIVDGQASIDGYLVDKYSKVVPVASETEAFMKAGIGFVMPNMREQAAAAIVSRWKKD